MSAAGAAPVRGSVFGGVFLGGDLGGPPRPPLSSVERGAAAIALDVHLEDCGVVDEAIDGGHRSGFVGEHLVPFTEGLVRRDQKRAPFVARRDELEEDAGLGLRGDSLERFRARLPELFAAMDDSALIQRLRRMGFSAALSGDAGLEDDADA